MRHQRHRIHSKPGPKKKRTTIYYNSQYWWYDRTYNTLSGAQRRVGGKEHMAIRQVAPSVFETLIKKR